MMPDFRMTSLPPIRTLFGALLVLVPPALASAQSWPVHSMERPKPPVVTPGPIAGPTPAPSDAIILFDGRDLHEWRRENGTAAQWKVVDGAIEVVGGTGSIVSARAFGDVQLHLEWATKAGASGKGQNRSNSGVYLMGRYEVQILDSHENETYADGQAAALYGQQPPMVNASRPAGEWQSYDIVFRRPHFDASGAVVRPARITVFHNGVLVHDAVPFTGATTHQQAARYQAHEDRRPITLQDHGDPVRFRNIWVRELPPIP